MPGQTPMQQPGQTNIPPAGMPSGPSLGDQAFVRQILESDAAEVKLGQLAQQKSQSDDVKQLGQNMVENRTNLDKQLKPIAEELSVNFPKEPSKKDRELIAKLGALSGPEFDQQYLQAVAKDNREDVKGFESEAQAAQNPNLQQAAKLDQPVIQQHLESIEKIAQSHNVAVDEKK